MSEDVSFYVSQFVLFLELLGPEKYFYLKSETLPHLTLCFSGKKWLSTLVRGLCHDDYGHVSSVF